MTRVFSVESTSKPKSVNRTVKEQPVEDLTNREVDFA